MIVDCDSCAVRGDACRDCVISVLLDGPPGAQRVRLDAPERLALDALAEQGLVPRLRLVASEPRRTRPPGPAGSPTADAG